MGGADDARNERDANDADDEESSLKMTTENLLVELFVEELPPKALQKLGDAFATVLGDQLKALGLPLACLTNKPLSFTQPLLAAKGLAAYFAHVFGGDSFERKKPDPLPLIKTCEALQSAPAHTLMVGDSSNDAQAADAAGCPVVLMTYGYNHGEPIRNTPARAWLDSLAHLPDLLTA